MRRPPPARATVPAPSTARRLGVLVLATVLTVAVVRSVLVQSFVVPTGSMDPTVRAGDRVLVSRVAYRFGAIGRGDVIVFDGAGVFEPAAPETGGAPADAGRAVARAFSMPWGAQDYVKRVVGLPGDRVICCDAGGRITVNGLPQPEPYLPPGRAPSTIRFDVAVPPGRLWVLGDNRDASADSRAHLGSPGGGTVPVQRVVGRVAGIYWPLDRAGRLAAGVEAAGPGTGPPRTDELEGDR